MSRMRQKQSSGVLIKRAFLEISQNLQEKTCARVSLSKNTFSYSTPLVAASGVSE